MPVVVPPPRLGPYCWPLKPFHRAHPVRGYFNDPRISGSSRAFHFGIDISAKDGTPVYAVEAGRVHYEGGRWLSVVCAGGRIFGYWHIVPVVRHRSQVRKHQLLGRIEAPWGHLHFAETTRKRYRNPLRPGALTPWTDPSSPRITSIGIFRGRRQLSPLQVKGDVDVIVEAFDIPPLAVPPPWANMPVTPAALRWRVLRGGKVVRRWHTPVDFRKSLIERELFPAVYAPGTRQNKPNKPGLYRFYVARGWTTSLLRNGLYRLQVEAFDQTGNKAVAALPFTIAN
jgi:Peptidase family M23